ncbi:phage late control D family protein [Martelella mediterranea]|uniref:Phage protein D n=1 Tax=Martelella mediterranea TaxID=293089 RepID=A0A4R3NVK0_9HYPH|nr:contractile injection system protein, VgrG/Pvc8 family [Martelella mediterranea]TCT41136.1 hypothetical protein EDC90_1007113 [Martelella mediterranea]
MATPFIEAKVNGSAVRDGFYNRLVSASIVDNTQDTADTCELTFDDADNAVAIPPAGAKLQLDFGYRPGGAARMGLFEIEKPKIRGGSGGEFITLSGRSTDMRKAVKEPADEHFDDMSAGDIVRQLADRHGYDAKVSENFDQLVIPYIARTNQSTADFLSRLARRTGAQFSIKDGKFLFLEPGILAPITIDKAECASWSFSIEPRPTYGNAKAGWYDRETNTVQTTTAETGLEGPSKTLRTTYATKEEAEAAARSEANRQAAKTGSGSITMAGRTDILAGTTINATGFRQEAAGLWYVKSVRHQFSNGYSVQISLEATKEGKKA